MGRRDDRCKGTDVPVARDGGETMSQNKAAEKVISVKLVEVTRLSSQGNQL